MFVSLPARSLALRALVVGVAAISVACASATGARVTTAPQPMPLHHVIPLPAAITVSPDQGLTLGTASRIVVAGDVQAVTDVAQLLAQALRPATGLPLPVVAGGSATATPGASPDITLLIDTAVTGGAEAYRLEVTPAGATLAAASAEGLFRASQTLRMLLPPAIHARVPQPGPWRLPVAAISDHPRFAWRGAMLDVARHFFDADQVMRYIDLLALYKFNVLHLHLSDDQGWRIAIDAWPRLTAHGGSTSVNGDRGGYFTKDQYRAIVAYASARYITVVPEIDLPGHTNAALASYTELNCNDTAPALYTGIKVGFSSVCVDRDVTFRFIDDVVREIVALTPGPYFHVGGDEVKTLTPEQYAGFVERVQAIVAAHGKTAIGWDEIAHARLASGTMVQQWRAGSADAMAAVHAAVTSAVSQGARFVMSPASRMYLDMKYDTSTKLGLHWAGYVEVRDTYDWDPATLFPNVTEASVLGVEAPLWTETIVTMTDLETMVLPRLAAVADLGWTPQAARTWDDFRRRLAVHALRWEAFGAAYYRSPQVEWFGRAAGRN